MENSAIPVTPEEIDKLLALGEKWLEKCDGAGLRLVQFQTLALGWFAAVFGFLVIASTTDYAPSEKAWPSLLVGALLPVGCVYFPAILYRATQRYRRDRRALVDLLNLLRETESRPDAKLIDRADFKIRISRLEPGPEPLRLIEFITKRAAWLTGRGG